MAEVSGPAPESKVVVGGNDQNAPKEPNKHQLVLVGGGALLILIVVGVVLGLVSHNKSSSGHPGLAKTSFVSNKLSYNLDFYKPSRAITVDKDQVLVATKGLGEKAPLQLSIEEIKTSEPDGPGACVFGSPVASVKNIALDQGLDICRLSSGGDDDSLYQVMVKDHGRQYTLNFTQGKEITSPASNADLSAVAKRAGIKAYLPDIKQIVASLELPSTNNE